MAELLSELTDKALDKKIQQTQEKYEIAYKKAADIEIELNNLKAEKDSREKAALLDLIRKSGKTNEEIKAFFASK